MGLTEKRETILLLLILVVIEVSGQTQLEFNIKGVDGRLLNGSIVTVYDATTNIQIGETVLANSQGTILITGVKETAEGGEKEGIKISTERLRVKIEQTEEGAMEITLTDILGRRIKEEEKRGRETEIKLEGLSNGVYILELKWGRATATRKIIKEEKQLYLSVKEGKREIKRSLRKGITDSYRIKIKGTTHYTRTIETTATEIEDYVVPYVEQEGVNDTLFYELCKEANFKSNFGFTGLKTSITENNPNNPTKIIIRSKGPIQKPYTVTQEDMQYIKNLIETEIYPHIKEELKPTIELRTLNTHEPLTINPGEIVIFPGTGYYIGSADYNGDGIIDDSYIELMIGEYQDSTRNGSKLQEVLSALVAPNQVDGTSPGRFEFKTVLSSGAAARKLTPMDIRLIQLGQKYKPKTEIDKILGME